MNIWRKVLLGLLVAALLLAVVADVVYGALQAPQKRAPAAKTAGTSAQMAIPEFPEGSDGWYLMQLLARDSSLEQVKFIVDAVHAPTRHPFVAVSFGDCMAPFGTRFDLKRKGMAFCIDRAFIRETSPSKISQASRDAARLLFVREATLAMTLEKDKRVVDYIDCATKAAPSPVCFTMLELPHLIAVMAEWKYAQLHKLTRLLPERDIAQNTVMYVRLGVALPAAEQGALKAYLYGGALPGLFWAERYMRWFDAYNDERTALRLAYELKMLREE